MLDGYPASEAITISSNFVGDRSYTAKWVRTSFKVQYDANGAEGTMEDSLYTTPAGGELQANTFTKEGYAFTGWNTKADGSGT